jgi:hypothetical protein
VGGALGGLAALSLGLFAFFVVYKRRSRTGKGYRNLVFFSYVKMDTVGETAALYSHATRLFPRDKIFRDADTSFQLDQLVAEVQASRNVVILLSHNYARRPYSVIELHMAIQSGVNLIPVLVRREGMQAFDFEQTTLDIESGAIGGYLDAGAWEIVGAYGVTPETLAADLKVVMNVRAMEFSTSLATAAQVALAKEILIKGLDYVGHPAEHKLEEEARLGSKSTVPDEIPRAVVVQPPTDDVESLSFDLKAWLAQVGGEDFVQYQEAMEREGFTTVAMLKHLGEEDLDAMGIDKRAHRNALLREAKQLIQ